MLAPPLSLAHVVALLSGEDQPEGAQQPLGRGGHLDSALRKSEAATQNIMMIYHSRRERLGGHMDSALGKSEAATENIIINQYRQRMLSSLWALKVIWTLLLVRARTKSWRRLVTVRSSRKVSCTWLSGP